MCGEGGSGLVYLVRLKNTTMFFALKVSSAVPARLGVGVGVVLLCVNGTDGLLPLLLKNSSTQCVSVLLVRRNVVS